MPQSATDSSPAEMHSLTPHIVCAGAHEAMDWYKKAFHAVELVRLKARDGKLVHGSLRIGDSVLMLAEENPAWGSLGPIALKGSPVTLHLMVPDVDATIAEAVAAGATLKMPATDMFWGDRYGQVVDPFGHRWSIATRLRTLTPDEMQAAMDCAFQ